METPNDLARALKRYSSKTARAVGDRANMILASMLPGCAPRRFDIPNPPYNYWPVEPVFNGKQPIVPVIMLDFAANNSMGRFYMCYHLLFQNMLGLFPGFTSIGTTISGAVLSSYEFIDEGPEAMAEAAHKGILALDLEELLAAGQIERILATGPQYADPWESMYIGQCAAYVGDDDEASVLLQDAIRLAEKDTRGRYEIIINLARTVISKLDENADGLRAEMEARVNYNWSHFKVVRQ